MSDFLLAGYKPSPLFSAEYKLVAPSRHRKQGISDFTWYPLQEQDIREARACFLGGLHSSPHPFLGVMHLINGVRGRQSMTW